MSLLPAALEKVAVGLAHTWHLEVSGEEVVERARRTSPVLFAVWHGQLLAPLWHRRREGVTLLVSAHADGQYLRRAARAWGYRVVLGSSTHGGAQGLRRLVRALRSGIDAAITPDGPRGPAGQAKGGAVLAATLSDAAVVPVAVHARHGWRLRSWDRFVIPAPATRVRVAYGPPIRFRRATPWYDGVTALERALRKCEDVCRSE